MEQRIAENSWKAWLLATRPKTLISAIIPVCIAAAWAFVHGGHRVNIFPLVLCFAFAIVMQIDANFINDYFDFRRGNDNETRLGPKRACAQGWVKSNSMFRAIILTTIVASLIGLPLIFFGGYQLILLGLACVVFCFLYTTHLSYWGLGDVLVLVFFGIVPVLGTFYLVSQPVTTVFNLDVVVSAINCGLVIDLLLIVNNFRDIDNDKVAGKKTLVVYIGKKNTLLLYCGIGVIVLLLGGLFLIHSNLMACLLPLLFLPFHISTFIEMKTIEQGKELNKVLGKTARNIFIYGLLLSIGILLG
ncbi:MAG: 1,4-dihydroxy-2-naphthoate octaprenyltransferase [Prevotella sp.]